MSVSAAVDAADLIETPTAPNVQAWLERIYGSQSGYAFAASGRYRRNLEDLKKWISEGFEQRAFRWPEQASDMVSYLTGAAERGRDTWFTPGLSANPYRRDAILGPF